MKTKGAILHKGDELIRNNGFNAFSYADISKSLGIKNAAVHYYFPSKADLGIEVIQYHISKTIELKNKLKDKGPKARLEAFLDAYSINKKQNKVCLVGSLVTDIYSLEPAIEKELKIFTDIVLEWISGILKEGKKKGIFFFHGSPRTKALLIITNMMGVLQLSRLTADSDFYEIKNSILNDLTKKK